MMKFQVDGGGSGKETAFSQVVSETNAKGPKAVEGQGPAVGSGQASAKSAGDKGGGQEEYLTIATKEKAIKRSTILLGVAFMAGVLAVFVMVRKSGPSEAAAEMITEDARIESAISRLTGIKREFLSRMDELAKKFYELSNVEQVEVYELKKNPFMHELNFKPLVDSAGGGADELDSMLSEGAMLQSRLGRKLSHMQLLSIIETSSGRGCMIDDTVAYEGDVVNGFTVVRINADNVELCCEGINFSLSISQD